MSIPRYRDVLVACGCSLLCSLLVTSAHSAAPAMRVFKGSDSGIELLNNGRMEYAIDGNPLHWMAAPKGFSLVTVEGRNGSRALRCENPTGAGWYGASQTIKPMSSRPTPLVIRGWSKAEKVNGSSDSDYSLYVDLVYMDGTPLWGQTANFRTGTHDWEHRELVIMPEKPVKSLTLNCLFRNHSGKVWFDDVSVTEVGVQDGAVLFQGVPIKPGRAGDELRTRMDATRTAAPGKFSTLDGLTLVTRGSTIVSVNSKGRELAGNSPSGFVARDVAADSDFYNFQDNKCLELGLNLDTQFLSRPDHILIEGRVSDTRGKDRAVTLIFALPIDALGWHWGDDIRHSRIIDGQGEFSKSVNIACGSTGTMALYPLGAIWNDRHGLALAIDMARPAQYRLGYHAGTKQLFIAYDFGLARETARFRSSAEFRLIVYEFEPRWGFRAAFQKLTKIYPDYFQVRSRDQGLWMPFTDISKVQGWQDFGFKYHEGNNNVEWDDAHGVLSFRYTEPMTWWMRMPKEIPRAEDDALRWRSRLAQGPQEPEREMAEISQLAAMWDESGQPSLLFRNEPWCNGAVWSLNPNPHLGPQANSSTNQENAATIHWNSRIEAELYGPKAKGQLDGEYLDSLEGYVTADLNFRREHFHFTTVPLTFSPETKQPVLFKGLAVYEFTHWFCDEVHRLGKLTFANGVPYRFTYLCPWLDVMGTETDWVQNRQYHPASDEQMSLWRTLAGAKPYLLLMNTDYDVFTPAMVERYFQRSLFYGMFPSMFSHNAADNPYWQNPKWYNRDRSLFKKYVPLVKRVAEAGWQPVTDALCDNPRIFVERFGGTDSTPLFFTVFNDTEVEQRGRLRIDCDVLGLKGTVTARELISGNTIDHPCNCSIELHPQETKVIAINSGTG